MKTHELYLPMLIPLWGIFIGIALIIVGFVDKKNLFSYAGWSVFMLTGLVSLYYNLFEINPAVYSDNLPMKDTAELLVTTGWLNVMGGALALAALLFQYFRRKRYVILAVWTLLFFAVQFFQYYSLIQKPK